MPNLKIQKTIAAPPTAVFDALTVQEQLERWFSPEVIAFPQEGTYAAFAYGFDLHFKVYLQKVEPGNKLIWEFVAGNVEWDNSIMVFTLFDKNGKTKLVFEHRRLQPHDKWEKWKKSWAEALEKLKKLLENRA